MIIDFTVENLLSIRDEQLLSMVAEKDHSHLSTNLYEYNEKISVLKTVAIFGPNGSGKTNVLFALDSLRDLVVDSGNNKDEDFIPQYLPYELSDRTIGAPVKFDIEFICKGQRYSYKIVYTDYEILFESLYSYPSIKPAKIFERTSPTNWKDDDGISFGGHFKGGKKRHAFFANNAYISIAGNSPESPKVIRDIYNYFRKSWSVRISETPVPVLGWENDELAERTMQCLMSNLGLGVTDFKIGEKPLTKAQEEVLQSLPKSFHSRFKHDVAREVKYGHKKDDGTIHYIEDNYESLGTRKLFDYLPSILSTLKQGKVLLVDEIATNFHSHVLELIISLFNDEEVNVNNAQLIFTTHDLMIMKSKNLRKDQIYLAEKIEGSTEYVSLDSFDSSLRKDSPFEKWYDEGRLGAIPQLDYSLISKSVKELVLNA
ncbi:ATP-binding protein [Vibrio harveyi]|uniref:AAA family ATPase n=1 Tax=Vibrio harveyi TaxID=669 RepID=UPI001EFC6AD9|nr:ATP-binding protein [Vibrio harveyi]MCG9589490.1 ATP-binding protein [Vibrio harveyi]CAH1234677.1 ATP-binding protein [Vibrio harveyi]CAH1554985.1 ATP-binding protein [Vibrio harveyi]CAH1561777.1 ATP-binding protein [Vibrio harveyi]